MAVLNPIPAVSLTAQSALNTVGAVMDNGGCFSNHTMVVTSSAGVSAGAVQLAGSLDGTNWFNLGSAVSTSTASTTFAPVVISNQPVRYLRTQITTAITGGTVTAVVASSR
jgi:hypothetical protein